MERRESRARRIAVYCAAVLGPVTLTTLLMVFPDFWPRPYSWQFLGISIGVAVAGGVRPALIAHTLGTLAVLWLARRFGNMPSPLHPGVEMFATAGVALMVIIHRLQRIERELRERNEALALSAAISEQSPDVIFAKDMHGRIRFANPAAVALIGKPLDRVIGKTVVECLDDKRAAGKIMENDRRILATGAAEEVEEQVPFPDGTHRIWLSRKSLYRDSNGQVAGLLAISRDITERKRAEIDNVRLARDAQASNQLKDQFLAMLSHELRTPLNVILGYGRILKTDTSVPDHVSRTSAIIERNAVSQLRMVEDLLDVQRILRGGIQIERAPFELLQLGQSVLESLHHVAVAKQLQCTVRFEPLTMEGDRARLQQVLWNLLSNAIKFTAPGGCISMSSHRDDAHVVIRVVDNGEGIPEHFMAHLFEPFRQADMTTTRRHGGLGLGLAIVKHIVDAHGGSIEVESELGVGSRFTVRLPIRKDVLAVA